MTIRITPRTFWFPTVNCGGRARLHAAFVQKIRSFGLRLRRPSFAPWKIPEFIPGRISARHAAHHLAGTSISRRHDRPIGNTPTAATRHSAPALVNASVYAPVVVRSHPAMKAANAAPT